MRDVARRPIVALTVMLLASHGAALGHGGGRFGAALVIGRIVCSDERTVSGNLSHALGHFLIVFGIQAACLELLILHRFSAPDAMTLVRGA
jgi:hypothetical protein